MHVLVLGLDQTVLDPASRAAARQRQYFAEWEVDILVLGSGSRKESNLAVGMRVLRPGGGGMMTAFWRTIVEARRLLRARKCSVITVQDPFLCALAALFAKRGMSVGVHVQDHSAFFARTPFTFKEKVLSRFARWMITRVDRVRTVSQRGQRGLIAAGVAPERIDVLPVMGDLTPFFGVQRTPEPARILCVARLEREKGVDVLMEAFARVARTVPNATLVLIGDGSARMTLMAQAERLGIGSRVMWHGAGALELVLKELALADVYVQPSRFEGWGMAVVEAVAAGVPIVMTDVGCAGELLHDGDSATVVPIGDVDALAQGMSEALEDGVSATRRAVHATKNLRVLLAPTETTTQKYRASLEAADLPTRLLVVTQRIDEKDPYLGVHVRWIEAVAARVDQVTVIAQSVGIHHLPANVVVKSLGKERGVSKWRQLLTFLVFARQRVPIQDAILVLMAPMYVSLVWLATWCTRRPALYLWYVHRHASRALRYSLTRCRRVFSATAQTFPLPTPKLVPIGHAIDAMFFAPDASISKIPGRIVTVGRVTPIKRLERIIDAVAALAHSGRDLSLEIVGAPLVESDYAYAATLNEQVGRLGLQNRVIFTGAVDAVGVLAALRRASLCVNVCPSGFDKAVLEALATGVPTLATNPNFQEILGGSLFVTSEEPAALAEAIAQTLDMPLTTESLRARVVGHHDLASMMDRLVAAMDLV